MVIFILILTVVYIIGAILIAMFIKSLFYPGCKTSTTKWILSMILVLLSFVGLILTFLYCVFIVIFEYVVIDNYKKWAIYKIFFRK